jgi:hypothetical protein
MAPTPQADLEPPIPHWTRDAAGHIGAVRDAAFWTAMGEKRIRCDLCWRRCDLADGEDGWCRYRGKRWLAGGSARLALHRAPLAVALAHEPEQLRGHLLPAARQARPLRRMLGVVHVEL